MKRSGGIIRTALNQQKQTSLSVFALATPFKIIFTQESIASYKIEFRHAC